jgi:hypothetical protein
VDRFKVTYGHERSVLQRLDSANGRLAAGYLTTLPRTDALTVADADFCAVTRLRLGLPPVDPATLPAVCLCGDSPRSSFHLLSCQALCGRAPGIQLGNYRATNLWDLRHRCLLEQLSADLVSAEVGVVIEPGPLGEAARDRQHEANDTDDEGARPAAPDQVITYVAMGKRSGMLTRTATDITICEPATEACIRSKTSVAALLNRKAGIKSRHHGQLAAEAGCGFVPLVFSSLGAVHKATSEFLSLNGMSLREELMEREFGGRRNFVNRMIDALSCALVRGNARMIFDNAIELARLGPRDRGQALGRNERGLRRFPPANYAWNVS